jgi:hypothetical protein
MAPTDITGSIKKPKVSMETTSSVSRPASKKSDAVVIAPSALADVPKGVTLRQD